MPRQPGKPREYTRPAPPEVTMGASAARRWMTADWRTRRTVRLRRLGEWVAMTRARLNMSLRDLERQARHDGEDISETLIRRLEDLRHGDANLTDVRRVSWPAVDYLATLSGQTLADVDAYLRTGEAAALEPSLNSDAETVRAAFLSLSPARRQSLEDFAQHLYQLDLAESAPAATTGSASAHASAHASAREVVGAVDAETQRARDELRAAGDAAIHALTQKEQGGQPEPRRIPSHRQAR